MAKGQLARGQFAPSQRNGMATNKQCEWVDSAQQDKAPSDDTCSVDGGGGGRGERENDKRAGVPVVEERVQ